jgi:glycosidase
MHRNQLPGPWEFHVSRAARQRYGFDEALFSFNGNVIFGDFGAARRFAERINAVRNAAENPDRAVKASDIHALGLIDEFLHSLVAHYRSTVNPGVFSKALLALEASLGGEPVREALTAFVTEFPPVAVMRGETSPQEYLRGSTDGVSHREIALEELLLLWTANQNPAFAPFAELFDDSLLRSATPYLKIIEGLEVFFEDEPGLATGGLTLFRMLLDPARTATTLADQLSWIQSEWEPWIGGFERRILGGMDFLAEEHKPVFPFNPGWVEPPSYVGLDPEIEAFSPDLDWMPRVVMLAKNTFVWLEQLSRAYDRPIARLDEVPDEELDRLASWGISGLWLIGLWERSHASARIKRWMGDDDAVASAYSLYDYVVAEALGGEAAYHNLKDRAWQRGIRMASDMVPNHVGIDGRWVIEHPDWFVGRDDPPYPTYRFEGKNLAEDDRVSIHIEDHYWNHADAAVVFKRVDNHTGAERYIYHGNDGTSMPWNDTAQLNYLNPEVREAVIQTILHVARMSPIIRFDAAMTLAKKHYHRLWFPEPGSGGDIPSRSEFAMTRPEFDEAMPVEFWREVVDRVAAEAPDTLLLAEAFWLLEGYFVRTLGMHRVYNSAFMNMLRDERNDEYRTLIKNTLEFDPQILKRYVNFMSNPDERTAIDQFGTDDKYFGVCTLMMTMPGLPMFGHGQIEGFAEKYGMEFHRARWKEAPNDGLIARHRHQVFPLAHRRGLFAEVDRFRLYDFYLEGGAVNEDVFAYSNEVGGERSLIVFHNRFADAHGWLRAAVPVMESRGDGERHLAHHDLAEGLRLPDEGVTLLAFRDLVSGLEYLVPVWRIREQGLELHLRAYEHRVYLDFREIDPRTDPEWAALANQLDGHGVPSLERAKRFLELAPLHDPWRRLLAVLGQEEPSTEDLELAVLGFLREAAAVLAIEGSVAGTAFDAVRDLSAVLTLEAAKPEAPEASDEADESVVDPEEETTAPPLEAIAAAVIGVAVEGLAEADDDLPGTLVRDWHLADVLDDQLRDPASGGDRDAWGLWAETVVAVRDWHDLVGTEGEAGALAALMERPSVAETMGLNRFEDTLWYRAEGLEQLIDVLGQAADLFAGSLDDEGMQRMVGFVDRLTAAGEVAGFDAERLLEMLGDGDDDGGGGAGSGGGSGRDSGRDSGSGSGRGSGSGSGRDSGSGSRDSGSGSGSGNGRDGDGGSDGDGDRSLDDALGELASLVKDPEPTE